MSRASDRAYNHIRNMILSGELQPGVQIREEELAELCGVSRTPVRDALRRLEAELFVRRCWKLMRHVVRQPAYRGTNSQG